MSVEMILGTTGAGKSYHACNHVIVETLKQGRAVYTNLPLQVDVFRERFGPEVADLITAVPMEDENGVRWFSRREHFDHEWVRDDGVKAKIIVDEARFCFPKGRTPEDVIEFFVMHRQMFHDIVIMAQDHTFIDPGVRKNVDLTMRMYNLEAIGAKLPGKDYREDRYAGAEPKGKPGESRLHGYSQKGFELYKSRMLSDQQGANVRRTGNRSMFLHPLLLCAYTSIILATASWIYFDPLEKLFGHEQANEAETQTIEPIAAVVAAYPTTSMKLVGVLTGPGGARYVVERGGRTATTVSSVMLEREGYRTQPARGCAIYVAKDGQGEARLVHCGERF